MGESFQLKHLELGADERPSLGGSLDMVGGVLDMVWGFLRRHWIVLTLAFLAGLGLAATSLAVLPVKYEAAATLLLDQQRLHVFQQQSVVSDPQIETYAAIEGQIEILKSDVIAKAVIRKLGLESDADFAVWPQSALTESQRERHTLEVFAKLRSIKRLGASFAIEIAFKSHSASSAAAVANAIIQAYLSDMWSASRTAARNAGDWIQERLTELRTETASAEQAVVDFKAKNDIIDVGGKQIVSQQIAEISSQLTTARSQLSDASARLERARAAAREYATSSARPAMTELLNNSLTNKLIEQYLELSNREAEYAERFGKDHSATLKLRQHMEEVKAGLLEDMERLSQTFLSEKTVLEKRVQDLQAALNAAVVSLRYNEAVQIKLRELESVAQSYRGLYDGLIRRHSEAVLQQDEPMTGARIISPASEPMSRAMKKPLALAAALAIGTMGLGFALSLLRDLKDRTFRTSDDVVTRLNSDFLAMIPTWRPATTKSSDKGRALVAAGSDRHVRRSNNAYWAYTLSPISAFAEAIGRLKFAILRQGSDSDSRIVGFTTVLPNEGASTIAAAVVLSLARSGRSVILVDCDLRHPELTREFAAHARAGLQDILVGEATLDDAILTDALSGFAFLPSVLGNLRARPEELLESEAMGAILARLKERYDYVIVDLPPLFPMLDVSITDRMIEAYVMIIEWGSSRIDTVAHALARCPGVRRRMLGFALNKVDFNRLSHYDPRATDYYNDRRYSNYLLKDSMVNSLDVEKP
jgi:polysaccharide biosynthesis transport protein